MMARLDHETNACPHRAEVQAFRLCNPHNLYPERDLSGVSRWFERSDTTGQLDRRGPGIGPCESEFGRVRAVQQQGILPMAMPIEDCLKAPKLEDGHGRLFPGNCLWRKSSGQVSGAWYYRLSSIQMT